MVGVVLGFWSRVSKLPRSFFWFEVFREWNPGVSRAWVVGFVERVFECQLLGFLEKFVGNQFPFLWASQGKNDRVLCLREIGRGSWESLQSRVLLCFEAVSGVVRRRWCLRGQRKGLSEIFGVKWVDLSVVRCAARKEMAVGWRLGRLPPGQVCGARVVWVKGCRRLGFWFSLGFQIRVKLGFVELGLGLIGLRVWRLGRKGLG